MSGIDEVLEDFDMFATPIHDGPSIGSGLTQGAPRRSSGSWARPSDAEFSQGRQIARCLCKGSVLIGAPRLPGQSGKPRARLLSRAPRILCIFYACSLGTSQRLSVIERCRVADRRPSAPLRSTGQGWQQTQPCPAKPRSRPHT